MRSRLQYPSRTNTICLALLFALLLSSCSPGTTVPTPTLLPPPHTAAPWEPPLLLYISGNELLEQRPGQAPRLLGTLASAGAVLAARRVGDTVWVLRTDGLQRISGEGGAAEQVVRFPEEALFGSLVPFEGGILYRATFSDPEAEFGFRTTIGLCSTDAGQATTVLSSGENLDLLGVTPDGEGLYLLPRGQDPAYGSLRIVSRNDGTVLRELSVEGEGPAYLSPGGRYLVCPFQNALRVYDLSADPPVRHVVTLPEAPGYVASLVWRDEHVAVLSLLSGDPYTLDASQSPALGLVQLDLASPALTPLTTGAENERRLLACTPGGRWLVTTDLLGKAQIWEGDSGRLARSASVPAGEVYAPALSSDGRWLLVRGVQGEEAAALRIPEGEVVHFSLPAGAVVVGWQ